MTILNFAADQLTVQANLSALPAAPQAGDESAGGLRVGVVVVGIDDAEIIGPRSRVQVEVIAARTADESEAVRGGVVLEIDAVGLELSLAGAAQCAARLNQREERFPRRVGCQGRIRRPAVRLGLHVPSSSRAARRRYDDNGAMGSMATGDGSRDNCGPAAPP